MASVSPPHSTLISFPSPPNMAKDQVVVDVVLRVMLLVTALVAMAVIATSKETIMIWGDVGVRVPVTVKYNDYPPLIYYVAVLLGACLYSIVTGLVSIIALMNPKGRSRKLLVLFAVLDALLLGIMASATGAAGAIAYDGLVGDTHKRRSNISIFSSFCRHIAGSVPLSLLPSVALLLLIWFSGFVLTKKMVPGSTTVTTLI